MARTYTVSPKVLAHLAKARAARKPRDPNAPKYISRTFRVPTAVYNILVAARLPREPLWETLVRLTGLQLPSEDSDKIIVDTPA